MKPMHKAVWAQLRGRQILPAERAMSPSLADEKLDINVEQLERQRTP